MQRNSRNIVAAVRGRAIAACAVALAALGWAAAGQASPRLPAGSPSRWFGPALVGWEGSYSFTPDFVNGTAENGRNHCETVGVGSTSLFPLSVSPSPSPTGWTISVGDQTNNSSEFDASIDWATPAEVGEMSQVAGLRTELQAVPPASAVAASGRTWYLQFFAPNSSDEACPPPALSMEQSPIGPAFPMTWFLGGGDVAGGAGCGYLAISGGPVSGPTTFTSTFLLTDALTEAQAASLGAVGDLQCAGGKVALPASPPATPAAGGGSSGTGATAAGCKVPRLLGETLARARSALASAGCRVGKVTRERSKKGRRGVVLSQTPHAGLQAARKARVSVVVSLGSG